jgi:hypothetical protein
LLGVVAGGVLQLMALAAPAAHAATLAPWWRLSSSSAPTYLRPGDKEDLVLASVSNRGDANANGSKAPIVITDTLPAGLTAKAVQLVSSVQHQEGTCEPLPTLRCTFTQDVQPYVRLEMRITVEVAPSLPTGQVENHAAIEGGETPSASAASALKIAAQPTPFGARAVELTPEDETGAPDLRAGSHPFQLTTTLDFNQTLEAGTATGPEAPALLKNLHLALPAGVIGDPQATPQCSNRDFSTLYLQDTNLCPANTVVGAAVVTLNEPAAVGYTSVAVPVFNLVPAPGEPARFGFEAFNVPVVLDTAVRTGGDYGVQVNVRNATSLAQVLGSEVTFWGEPGDPRHDQSRGWGCIVGGLEAPEGESCEPPHPRPTTPFLTLPTSCEGPLTATLTGDSWSGDTLEGAASIPALSGCGELPFTPSIAVKPETQTASTPTGLSVDVKVPQTTLLEEGGLAEADVRDTTVTFPSGVELSPSAANGLQACSEEEIGFKGFNAGTQTNEFTTAKPSCPDASKVGLVHIRTPLLSHELEGSVYLAAQEANPFGSLIAVYVVAEDPVSGVLVKLAGKGELNESTLRVATTFTNTPQVPFEDLKIDLFGGPRASLSTPPFCGSYPTDAAFTPWSGTGPASLSSPPQEFGVTSGASGGGCPGGSLGFSPGFNAQSSNTTAGAFTPFVVEITRGDGDQALSGISVHLPPGVSGMLSSVTRCPEPQAQQGTCGPESLVGHAIESSGLGPEPYVVGGGRVYITGPYGGAPFGLSIVTPAVAGPFNLGTVIVRSRIFIDRETAALTIVSDPLPTQLKGIPLQLKRIQVLVDRPGFQFNPTSCSPMKVEGTLTGDRGASANVSSPFQIGGCASLPFSPTLTASTQGQTSKLNGASLTVRVTSSRGQANISKTVLTLPKTLPARLTTLQKACIAAVFEANPGSCPEGSVIGTATVHTPVLTSPLTGPAYLVSHGNAAFPDVEFVLQGEGITLILDGQTNIKGGVTTSTFNAVPDAPVTTFETTLPEGPHSALGATSSLCGQTLTAPTTITGQNAAVITQNTPVTITGCQAVKSYKATRTQLLAKALAACRKKYKHNHTKRVSCERQARKRYAAAKKTAHKAARSPHGHSGR